MTQQISKIIPLINRYHTNFISDVLSGEHIIYPIDLQEYFTAYRNNDLSAMTNCLISMGHTISQRFELPVTYVGGARYKLLNLMNSTKVEQFIAVVSNSDLYSSEEKSLLATTFAKNFTEFSEFHDTCSSIYSFDMYSGQGTPGSIVSWLLDNNLPIYTYNIIMMQPLPQVLRFTNSELFTMEGFNQVLSPEGIRKYNAEIVKLNRWIAVYNMCHRILPGKIDALPKLQLLCDHL